MLVKKLELKEEVVNGKLVDYIEVKTKNDKSEKITYKLEIMKDLELDPLLVLLEELQKNDVDISEFLGQFQKLGENPLQVVYFVATNKEKIYTVLSLFFNAPKSVFKRMNPLELGNVIYTCYHLYKDFLAEMGLSKEE